MDSPQRTIASHPFNIHEQVSTRLLPPALQARRHALHATARSVSRAAILLTSGQGEIAGAGVGAVLQAPALVWLPVKPGHYLRVAAGTSGILLTFSDLLVREAIGQGAESAHLRFLNDRVVTINHIGDAQAIREVRHSCEAIGREVRRNEFGSWTYLLAHAALIMVQCWRLSGLEDLTRQDVGTRAAVLLNFRHLVEMHFRQRWRIADYAQALGMSTDRLHDICVRALERTPIELLHERVVHEAALHLARSGKGVEALADELGFRSATHFSRFFSQRTGLSPARYRQRARAAITASDALPAPSYADWP